MLVCRADAYDGVVSNELVGERFAATLDDEDWAGARSLLARDCEYAFRGGTLHGPEAIIGCYRDIGQWVHESFDSVRYESRVEAMPDGRVRIHFRDRIDHGEHHLDFRCQQVLSVDERGLIDRIEHVDLPGERERADAFNRACGVERP